ncbi:MAG: hypothetical protein KAR35_05940 [Candidatus Heimdallarchaeota archaeon]|nr:hypothetical protein [Candidatus Heimdallarchaeota archaeon]MCK5048900.1 hypothetical protein [Candidatus Heimdallarchaeota archaeon]
MNPNNSDTSTNAEIEEVFNSFLSSVFPFSSQKLSKMDDSYFDKMAENFITEEAITDRISVVITTLCRSRLKLLNIQKNMLQILRASKEMKDNESKNSLFSTFLSLAKDAVKELQQFAEAGVELELMDIKDSLLTFQSYGNTCSFRDLIKDYIVFLQKVQDNSWK